MSVADTVAVQATAVAIDGCGVLLCGAPGSGKSDLAIQLVDRGALLIADDLVTLSLVGGWLHALPAPRLAGRLMLRGAGPFDLPHSNAPVPTALAVMLGQSTDAATLHPSRAGPFLGCHLPQIAIDPARASAAAVITLALARWGL